MAPKTDRHPPAKPAQEAEDVEMMDEDVTNKPNFRPLTVKEMAVSLDRVSDLKTTFTHYLRCFLLSLSPYLSIFFS